MEAPAHRTQAPQSTGVHNQRVPPTSSTASQQQGQAIHQAEKGSLCKGREAISLAPGHPDRDQPVTPALSTSHQESSVIVTTQDQASTALRRKMREQLLKEMEALWESKVAERTLDVEKFCRRKRDGRRKIVEDYWKQKLVEAQSNGKDNKTNELYDEIEILKKKLEKGPGLIKAAEERGKRHGELDGFNKFSLKSRVEAEPRSAEF